jgi:hypothetical protein
LANWSSDNQANAGAMSTMFYCAVIDLAATIVSF